MWRAAWVAAGAMVLVAAGACESSGGPAAVNVCANKPAPGMALPVVQLDSEGYPLPNSPTGFDSPLVEDSACCGHLPEGTNDSCATVGKCHAPMQVGAFGVEECQPLSTAECRLTTACFNYGGCTRGLYSDKSTITCVAGSDDDCRHAHHPSMAGHVYWNGAVACLDAPTAQKLMHCLPVNGKCPPSP